MKRIYALVLVLLALALGAGCGNNLVNQVVQNDPTAYLFNYDGMSYSSTTVLIKVESSAALESVTKAKGLAILKDWTDRIGWALISVPQGKDISNFVKHLRSQQGVLLAEPNFRYEIDPLEDGMATRAVANVDGYELQWGFKNIRAEEAWDITTGSPDVIVAVVDTGVDITRPEFADKIIAPRNCTGDGRPIDDVVDQNSHGTHVAGIAAANPRNEDAMIAGVAWDCSIMPVRVEDNGGSIFTSYLIEAMLYVGDYMSAHRHQRAVVNMSIGGRGYNFSFKDAIDYAAENGVLLVCSMGNDSKRVPQYSSGYNGVVPVAASTPYDTKASFSTMGWWCSVAAPGVQILSTVPGGYGYKQGTSMASPFVAGAAALLLSKPGNENLSALEIKNQLEQTAKGHGFNEALGYGVIDLVNLLGPIKPMVYGSLKVDTNIDPGIDVTIPLGIITVYDRIGRVAAWGTTGMGGDHMFHALKPGTYRVNVSHFEPYFDKYVQRTATVNVTVGQTQTAIINFEVPSSVTRDLVGQSDYLNVDGESTFLFHADSSGYYEIFTSALGGVTCDTYITLLNSSDTVLAENDDHGSMFSMIAMNLPAGDYKVIVRNFESAQPHTCHLEVNAVHFSF